MLQAIKERAQGWVAWAIVILISVPFALWGIQSYLGVGAEPVVAKVGGTKITERELDQNVQRSRMQLRERLGAAYDPDLFENAALRAQVLERMVRDTVLLDASYDMGLRVSDQAVQAAILAEPAFQSDGVFDKDTYEGVLRLQGLTPMAYEERLRSGLLSTQLARALTESGFTTDAELAAATRLLRQQRDIAYLLLPRDRYLPETEPSAEEIQAYYDANPQRFESPERVKLSYILLDADTLGAAEAVDDAALLAAYEARIEEFREPERRSIRHILLTVPADADDAEIQAVKERIAELRAQIEAGEDFSSIAKAHSEDPVSGAQGGELGMVERGIMDPAFEQAAFALEAGIVSEPVRSRFGYHLIEVTDIEGGAPKPFDEVRDQLAGELDRGGAETAYFELAEQLANLSYESPDSLIPAAETLDLEIQTSDWIERGGGEGILGNARVMAAAFSEDVLATGNNSELIEPDPDRMQAIVLRVDEHEPAAVRPLDEVRDEIVETLKQQQAAAAALAAAEDLVERLRGGADLASLAAELAPPRADPSEGEIDDPLGGASTARASRPEASSEVGAPAAEPDTPDSDVAQSAGASTTGREPSVQTSASTEQTPEEPAAEGPMAVATVATGDDEKRPEASSAPEQAAPEQQQDGKVSGIEEPGLVSRNQADVPPTVLELAFGAPRPGEGSPSYVAGQEPSGDAVVVVVRAIVDGDSEDLAPAARDAERRLLTRTSAEHGFQQVLDDLVSRADIERRTLSSDDAL